MAVDYFHRLIIRGPQKPLRAFRRQIYRKYPRSIGRKSRIEVVPFSFEALYDIAPRARRVEPEVPCDPYDLSTWPIRPIGRSQAEIRYQFHTRNLEMVGLIRVLSRARPVLIFILVTFCLDDTSIEVYQLRRGSTKKWALPQRRRDFHWNRARIKFGVDGDDVYDNEEAEQWVEEEMLHEAMTHWYVTSSDNHLSRRSRYAWWNRPTVRDLQTEQQLLLYELAERFKSKKPRRRSKTGRRTRTR